VRFIFGEHEERQEVVFLNNLKEDLQVLENSWRKRRPNRKKILKHFIEILDSILDIARAESLEPYEDILGEVRSQLTSDASKRGDSEDQPWGQMWEIIDLLTQSLRDGAVPTAALEACRSRWNEQSNVPDSGGEEPSGDSDHPVSSPETAHGEVESSEQEEEMSRTDQADPNNLLERAQQALLSGDGENAKELALKAAEIIARQGAEEAEKKRELLKADLDVATQLEAEAEETFRHIKEQMTEREQETGTLANSLAENESALEERKRVHREIKDQLESTEVELAALKEKHGQLLEQFQEALPARDAAERECTRLRTELEKAESEVAALRESSTDAENQLTQARWQKQEIEAKLEKLMEKQPA